MDKFTVALASLIIFVLLLICAVTLMGQSLFYPQAGENGNVTAAVIRIALADTGVAQATNNSYGKTCLVTNVSAYGDDGRSGLIGVREKLLKVSLMFGSTWSVGENRGLTVDVDSGKIVGREQYFRRLGMPPYTDSFLVPPGATWYRRINGAYYQMEGVAKLLPDITFDPADAQVYATVVDDTNLSLFKDGLTYAPLQFIDPDTNLTSTCENRLILSPWQINMSIPDPGFHGQRLLDTPGGSYYVLLKNADPLRYVEMTYKMMRM